MAAASAPLAEQAAVSGASRPTTRRVALRIAAVAAAAVLLAAVHLPWRPRTLCLFRAVTGLPCPFCGGTTAVVRLGQGDLRGALGASPVGVAMVAYWPFLGVVRPPGWLRARRTRWTLIGAILLGSEVFQLLRFHVI